ncbi:MAG: trypsin-like peptidase domain-containing protein [Anaerolineae bacterium]|nr:trypsin-like peptidase domain-containing protein [Anaerolineae bacterium]
MRYFALLWIALLLSLRPPATAAQGGVFDLERIQRATVFIMQARIQGNDMTITCVGSGTIVHREGLILTNAHHTLKNAACPGDILIVAFATRIDEAPLPKYRAEIIQANPGLDLALLRITRQFDGRLIESGSLTLPFVELADSTQTQLDDTITIVGYPGTGDDAVDIRRGTISGFAFEPSSSGPAWIRTRAEIPGTMSGGGAYNQNGQLVGIPTTATTREPEAGVNCVAIQDTNQDGLVNSNDLCIPTGTFINSLRPSDFARSLLRAASLGLTVDTPAQPETRTLISGAPSFGRLFFSPSVNEAGMPTSVVSRLPAGSTSLYLFFDYENMTSETVYELRVTTDGIPNQTFSLAPVRWSGGTRGLWYVGSEDQPWPNGIYEFTLFADGRTAGNARLVIGGAAEPEPTFSNIVFGIVDNRGTPLGNGFVLPAGNIANARFIFRNMQVGDPWTAIWYYNGTELARTQDDWSNLDGESGAKTIQIEDASGLPPGTYRLELYIDNRLSSTSDFIIAGAQQGVFPQVFSDVHFASANSLEEAASASAVSSFTSTISTLYGLFDWQQIAPGTLWTLRVSVDNTVFYEQTAPWSNFESGVNYLVRLNSEGGIPDGTYKLDLLVNNVPLASAIAQVGIGQLPIDRFATVNGLQLRGRIFDAETGQGIAGITFVLITEDYSVAEFEWRQDQIFATAITDRNGSFQVARLLEFEVPYSAIIAAEGYLPIGVDGFEVTAETPNPLDMSIPLTRG